MLFRSTLLTCHILTTAGIDAGLAGNVGRSLAAQVAEDAHPLYVVELSSFQLDGMFDFRADIAVLTNITPDHLDRYDHKFENYIDSKFRILNNMRPQDLFIYGFPTARPPLLLPSRHRFDMYFSPIYSGQHK